MKHLFLGNVLFVVVAGFMLVSCSTSNEPVGDTPMPLFDVPTAGMTIQLLRTPVPIEDVTMETLDGQTMSTRDWHGKVTLVNYWATWCGPCRLETPYLQKVYEENQERGLRIVGISVDSEASRDAVEFFLEENGVTYDILLDPDMVSTDVFAALGLPATFLIDQEGVIRFKRLGPILEGDPDFLEALERSLD